MRIADPALIRLLPSVRWLTDPVDPLQDTHSTAGLAAPSPGTLLVVPGTAGNDSLVGTTTADTINGEGGRDTLDGLGGNDLLSGGTANDRLLGKAGNDTLDGGAGADRLEGGAGDDLLIGGAGNDALLTGPGSDTIVIGPGGGRDSIQNFTLPVVLTFDDVATDTETGPIGAYGGLSWTNMGVVNTTSGYLATLGPQASGYAAASPGNIAFIGSAAGELVEGYPGPAGLPVTATSTVGEIDLVRGFFSGAARDVTVIATAWDDGILVGQKTFLAVQGGQEIRFDEGLDFGSFASIDRFEFASNDGDPATRDYFGIDDLAYRTDRIVLEGGVTVTAVTDVANGAQVTLSSGGGFVLVGATAAQVTDDLFA